MQHVEKNHGSFQALDKAWFERRQNILLGLLNFWATRRLFRWILRMRKDDLGYDRPIVGILPNCYTVFDTFLPNGRIQLTTDFRSHPKYAKRLYYAFRPLWWAMHAWDGIFADLFMPQLSFGFATLTKYSDPNPETNTVDGHCFNDNSTSWATTVGLASSNFSGDTDPSTELRNNQNNGNGPLFFSLTRTFHLFDTSALTAIATISAASFSLANGSQPGASSITGSEQRLHVVSSAPASNTAITANDYNDVGSTSFGTTPTTWVDSGAYNDVTLNASGISNISTTGISKFGIRGNYDITSTAPVDTVTEFGIDYDLADNTGTSSDPKLVVTYVALTNQLPPKNALRPRFFAPGIAR